MERWKDGKMERWKDGKRQIIPLGVRKEPNAGLIS